MNKLRELLRNSLVAYMILIFVLAAIVMFVFSTYFSDAGVVGDTILVMLIFGIVVGGTFLHQKI